MTAVELLPRLILLQLGPTQSRIVQGIDFRESGPSRLKPNILALFEPDIIVLALKLRKDHSFPARKRPYSLTGVF